jgi:hypothetical protein
MYAAIATLGSGLFFTNWQNVSLATVIWLVARIHPALSAGAILVLIANALADERQNKVV